MTPRARPDDEPRPAFPDTPATPDTAATPDTPAAPGSPDGPDAPAPDTAPGGRSPLPAGASRAAALALLLVMVLSAVGAFACRSTTAPAGADAPQEAFSAARATEALEPVAGEPRPIGSAAFDAAQAHLSGELEQLGFAVEIQEVLAGRSDEEEIGAAYSRNLVATRPGTDPTGTLVLATHLDSVPMAPGASDAGIGIAVILETVRALGPEALRNDLVVLLVDGEEDGLLGAEGFLRDGAEDLAEPVLVLNHEARGVGGRPMITRMNGPVHPLLEVMPRPEAESYIEALFAIIPNDTDFTVYRQAGWWGMDMAIVDGSWAYHSPEDDLAHLDASTLQHYGDLTLSLSREVGERDLGALEAEGGATPVLTTTAAGILRLPPAVVAVVGLLAPLAVLAALVVLRSRGGLGIPGTVLGAFGGLLAIVGSVAAGIALWEGARAVAPQMLSVTVGEPVHARLFFVAEIAATLAVLAVVWVLARLRLSPAAMAIGAGLPGAVLVAALAVVAPDLGAWLVLPVAAVSLGGLLALVLPGPSALVVRLLAVAPVGWMIGQQTSGLMEFGIASANGGLAGTLAIGLLAAAVLLAPGRDPAPERRARSARPAQLMIPAVLLVLAVAASGIGIAVTRGSQEPMQTQVFAHVDGADGSTRWEASGAADWARAMDGSTADSRLPGPQVEVVASQGDQLELAITSARGASRVDITLEETPHGQGAGLRDVELDGLALDGEQARRISVVGLRPEQTIRLEARVVGRPGELVVSDSSFDLAEAGGHLEPPEDVSAVRSMVHVRTAVELEG